MQAATLIALAAACSPGPDRTAGRPGDWLVDLDSVDCGVAPLISTSSDGRWLVFWLSYFRPDAGLSLPLQSLALLDWPARRLFLPAGPADRVTGPSFDPDSLCWDDQAQRVFVQAGGLSTEAAGRWFSVALENEAELTPNSRPPDLCRRPAPQQWQWHRSVTERPELRRGLRITSHGCCELVLSTEDGTELATHEAQRDSSDQLSIARFAWSPDGENLAYTVSEQVSWRFELPSFSYVVSRHRSPERLEGEIFSLAWYDDKHLIGCTASERPGGGNGLKQWRFDVD